MFKLTITCLTFFWVTILYMFQYLLVSISHVYVFVNSVKLKIKRTIFNLFFHRHISRQHFFVLLAWQPPIMPGVQSTQVLISKHLVFTNDAKIIIVILCLLNIMYIINFYVQHYEDRPKPLLKSDRKRWYIMVCWTALFIFLFGLIIFLFDYYLPPLKPWYHVSGGGELVDCGYREIIHTIRTRVFLYNLWKGCLASLLLLVFFISWYTGVKLKPNLDTSETNAMFTKGTGGF